MDVVARKNNVLFTTVSCCGFPSPEPVLMSFTKVVPAAVLSVRQSSCPKGPLASKYTYPFMYTKPEPPPPLPPGTISVIIYVPPGVPSLTHGSNWVLAVKAVKYSKLLATAKLVGLELGKVPLVAIFTNKVVPAAVPSLTQGSFPFTPSLAEKYNFPLYAIISSIPGEPVPAMISFTSTVPAAVPSLFHNSVPKPVTVARKNNVPFTFTGV